MILAFGAVHILCRLFRGEGVKALRLYLVKDDKGGERVKKSPISLRHILWMAPFCLHRQIRASECLCVAAMFYCDTAV